MVAAEAGAWPADGAAGGVPAAAVAPLRRSFEPEPSRPLDLSDATGAHPCRPPRWTMHHSVDAVHHRTLTSVPAGRAPSATNLTLGPRRRVSWSCVYNWPPAVAPAIPSVPMATMVAIMVFDFTIGIYRPT